MSFTCLLVMITLSIPGQSQNIITTDIDNFWAAYDKITATKDSAQQYQYLDDLFLKKGTPGLEAIMQARNYTPKSYIDAINNYPKYWNSIRANTLKASSFAGQIAEGIDKLRALYPVLKPATIYFTIGAFRTSGTTLDDQVLIGAEMALGDEKVDVSELPVSMNYVKDYLAGNPIEDQVFLNVHEFVHTQQASAIGTELLNACLREGVAEFIAVKAVEQPSTTPAVAFGQLNEERVRAAFQRQMFHLSYSYWLWSDMENEFAVRDLGYYVGYAIAERYYEKAEDKKRAIKELIEVDYRDNEAVARIVDESGYFSKPVKKLRKTFAKTRPKVISVSPIKNGDKNVDPSIKKVTIEFSQPMDTRFTSFDLGPLGMDGLMRVQKLVGFSEDGRSVTVEVNLEPGRPYQLLVNWGFRNEEGVPLKPFLIDFRTSDE